MSRRERQGWQARDLGPLPGEEGDEGEGVPEPPEDPTIPVRSGKLLWWLGKQSAVWAGRWYRFAAAMRWVAFVGVPAALAAAWFWSWAWALAAPALTSWPWRLIADFCLRRAYWFTGGEVVIRPPGGIDEEIIEEETEEGESGDGTD